MIIEQRNNLTLVLYGMFEWKSSILTSTLSRNWFLFFSKTEIIQIHVSSLICRVIKARISPDRSSLKFLYLTRRKLSNIVENMKFQIKNSLNKIFSIQKKLYFFKEISVKIKVLSSLYLMLLFFGPMFRLLSAWFLS